MSTSEIELTIQNLSYGTAAIGRDETGKTVFVEGAAPGDTVRAHIDTCKKSYSTAHTVEVLKAGEARVAPTCPHVATCGGCQWQHIAYEAQLEAKRDNIVANLIRIGHFDREAAERLVTPCVPSKRTMGYRNKLELAAGTDEAGRIVLGFHRNQSHEIDVVGTCPLGHKQLEKTPKALQGALRYLQGNGVDLGIYRVGIRHSLRTHSTEIALWTPPSSFPRGFAAKTLSTTCKATSIVRVMADPGKTRAIKGVEVLWGKGYWEEELYGTRFKVSAPSFFQVNTGAAEKLVDLALEGLQVSEGDTVADLYCGVGTFTLPLAARATTVYAVESAGSSVRDLRRVAEANGAWIDIIGGDSARELPTLGALDALLVDPPRSGLADGVIDSIAATAPRRVAYVSCDPATWARDAARFDDAGYDLKSVTPVDLFPQTYHCELVSIFERFGVRD